VKGQLVDSQCVKGHCMKGACVFYRPCMKGQCVKVCEKVCGGSGVKASWWIRGKGQCVKFQSVTGHFAACEEASGGSGG
jgi:hypothetical protein